MTASWLSSKLCGLVRICVVQYFCFWNRISCPGCFRACSATADFSGCFSLQCLSCSLILVWMLHFVVPIYTYPQLQGIWYTPAVVRGSLLSFADRNICCIFVVGLNTLCRLCFFKSFPMRSVTPLMYGKNTLFVDGCFPSSVRCCFLGLMALLISFLE